MKAVINATKNRNKFLVNFASLKLDRRARMKRLIQHLKSFWHVMAQDETSHAPFSTWENLSFVS